MDVYYISSLWCLVVLVALSSAIDLPDFIQVCKKSEIDNLDCFIKSGDKLKPYLATGVPEYNIPSIEPLVINELLSESIGTLNLVSKDIKAWGCSDYRVQRFNIDMEKQTYQITTLLPLLKIEGRYNVSGKVLMMPIRGDGPLYANLTNVLTTSILQGELYEKDGATYLKYTSMTINTKVGGGDIRVENLFNGDKLLNDVVNETINKNIHLFMDELMPLIEKALTSTFLEISNNIIKQFTYNQLFP